MKRLLCIFAAACLVLGVSSCIKGLFGGETPKEEEDNLFGVDGVTPMPKAVDLGIVVNGKSVKWASFNLGASREYEYGDYYAWGEMMPYYTSLNPLQWRKEGDADLNYDWPSYRFANGTTGLLKYCPKEMESDYWDLTEKPDGADNQIELLPADDVVRVKLGGNWRIPTQADIAALLALKDQDDYDLNLWAAARDENGKEVKDRCGNVIHGLSITRRSTGASLFLPAADWCNKSVVGVKLENGTDISGNYWSATLDPTLPFRAKALIFTETKVEDISSPDAGTSTQRCRGLVIRPVTD